MQLDISAASLVEIAADVLIVPVFADPSADDWLAPMNSALSGLLDRLRERGDLTAKLAETCLLPDVPASAAAKLLFVGLGDRGQLNVSGWRKAMATALRQVTTKSAQAVAVAVPPQLELAAGTAVEHAVCQALIASVGQGVYLKEAKRHPLASLTFVTEDSPETRRALGTGHILGDAINLTRDLVNRCADEIYPESVADRVSELAASVKLDCRVLDQAALEAERMGSLLAVARGSDREPRVVELRYEGNPQDDTVLAIVGKGVCFDSGGLSLKTSEGMATMKADMAGAATVVGAMSALARLQPRANVRGYLGLVENMVSGRSYKLGDVLRARNGVTIEVLNTDAEGRLVLADVLDFAVSQGATKIVDLATLTGACVVALGEEVTGSFTNNSDLADQLHASAARVGEDVWPLPMFEHYAELLKSDVADCKNIGGRWGGAITAAKFLEKFVSETPWVHLDIAGPSFASSDKPHREGGATGVMVHTLVELVRSAAARKSE